MADTVDWRAILRELTTVVGSDHFPLVLYQAEPSTGEAWPGDLVEPGADILELYQICNGAYLGGHHCWFSLQELLEENSRLGELSLDQSRHVILGREVSGFLLVWSKDDGLIHTMPYEELSPTGISLEHLMEEIFSPDYPDDIWQEALRLLRDQ